MGNFETNNDAEIKKVPEQEETLDELKGKIKDTLFSIDKQGDELLDNMEEFNSRLTQIEEGLNYLKTNHPNDPDIFMFERLFEDLKSDFEVLKLGLKEAPEINRAYDLILNDIKSEFESAGVKRESPDETIIADKIAQLRSIGIEPEYVSTCKNPNAPTIVLFKQIHSNPGFTEEELEGMGTKASQEEIANAISSAMENGLIDTVYSEGLPADHTLDSNIAEKLLGMVHFDATYEAKIKHGEKINIKGYEEMGEVKKAKKDIDNGGGFYFQMRATAHNIMIASNVAESAKNNEGKMTFMTLGAGHENNIITGSENPVPISEALAYYGMNVVVVDASEYYDSEKAEKAAVRITSALKN